MEITGRAWTGASEPAGLARRARSPGRVGARKAAYDYVAGGAGAEETVRANREAFRRWRIVPRFLRDVGRRDLGVEILGTRFPCR